MKAKVVKKIAKIVGIKKDGIYDVVQIADDKEGVWVKDEYNGKVFLKNSWIELFHEDGITKFEKGSINVTFGGMFPKSVVYDEKSKTMTVIW